jgi:hypothetical protein
MTTHGLDTVRAYFEDMLRYTNADTVTDITCPTFVTDNETDPVSTGQGKVLYDHTVGLSRGIATLEAQRGKHKGRFTHCCGFNWPKVDIAWLSLDAPDGWVHSYQRGGLGVSFPSCFATDAKRSR